MKTKNSEKYFLWVEVMRPVFVKLTTTLVSLEMVSAADLFLAAKRKAKATRKTLYRKQGICE